jgi:2-amino-4-hydroxy-6-hydroxymethyldihydropteridine diphosphokinase
MIYYLALGSNMGDRQANIRQAVDLLNTVGTVLKISSVYETEPVDMAPITDKFYNLVLSFDCVLTPRALLEKLKNIEKRLGRDVTNSHKKPRPMDIDILLAGEEIINTKVLTVPHREMHKRGFVLVPLNEIAPEVVHPVLGKKVNELLGLVPRQA